MTFRESLDYLREEGFIIDKDGIITLDRKRPRIGQALDSKVEIDYQFCNDFEEFELAAKLAELCRLHNTPYEEKSIDYAKRILERERQIEEQNLYAQTRLLERYFKVLRSLEQKIE